MAVEVGTVKKRKRRRRFLASDVRLGNPWVKYGNDYDVVVWDRPLLDGIGSRCDAIRGILSDNGVLYVTKDVNGMIGGMIEVSFERDPGEDTDEYVAYRKRA